MELQGLQPGLLGTFIADGFGQLWGRTVPRKVLSVGATEN